MLIRGDNGEASEAEDRTTTQQGAQVLARVGSKQSTNGWESELDMSRSEPTNAPTTRSITPEEEDDPTTTHDNCKADHLNGLLTTIIQSVSIGQTSQLKNPKQPYWRQGDPKESEG